MDKLKDVLVHTVAQLSLSNMVLQRERVNEKSKLPVLILSIWLGSTCISFIDQDKGRFNKRDLDKRFPACYFTRATVLIIIIKNILYLKFKFQYQIQI